MAEYTVPIMFDVTSATRPGAVARLVDALVDADLVYATDGVESWWTLEECDKVFDGNDNEAGRVVFGEEPEVAYGARGHQVWVVTYVKVTEHGNIESTVEVYSDGHAANTSADTWRAEQVGRTAHVVERVLL